MKRETVEGLIARVMAAHPGQTPAALRKYFEEVHQELAPLARALETENAQLRTQLAAKLDLTNVVGLRAPAPRTRNVFTCERCGTVYRAGDVPVLIWGENGNAWCRACTPACDVRAGTAQPMRQSEEARQ